MRAKMDLKKSPENKPATSRRSPRDLVCLALSIAFGLIVGWLDLHVTEVIVTIVALYVSGMIPGLIQPSAAWRWALLIVIGLPVLKLIAIVFNMQTAEPVHLDLRITLVALVITLLGTYSGVFIRYVLRT
ncbi:MAG: hypothetical protein ACWGNV_15135 [Bacteroidales bacterium]